MTDGAVPLHSDGQSEVNWTRESNLSDWKNSGYKVKKCRGSPERWAEIWKTEDRNREADIDEIEDSKSKHEVMEVTKDDLVGKPYDAHNVPNNAKTTNDELK